MSNGPLSCNGPSYGHIMEHCKFMYNACLQKKHCPLRHFNSAGSKMLYCKRKANRKSLLVLRNSVADVCIETNNVKTSVGGKLDILCGQLMSACLYNKICC